MTDPQPINGHDHGLATRAGHTAGKAVAAVFAIAVGLPLVAIVVGGLWWAALAIWTNLPR